MVFNPNSRNPSLPIDQIRGHGQEAFPGTGFAPRDRSPLSSPSSEETGRNLSVSSIPLARLTSRRTFASGQGPGGHALTPAQIASCSQSDLGEEEEYAVPIATSQCLQDFASVEARKRNSVNVKIGEEKAKYVAECKAERQKHQETLKRLRAWRRRQNAKGTVKGWLKSSLFQEHKWQLPSHDDLVQMALYYYPLRKDVKIYICDFGAGQMKFEKKEIPMGEIEEEFTSKPDWADVRWVHAPLNVGLVQSSLEDIFLKGNRSTGTMHAQNVSWPYAQVETISFRKREDLKDMQDVYMILGSPDFQKKYKEIADVQDTLDDMALKGLSEDFAEDIKWRADHWGLQPKYWALVLSDLHRQMSNSSAEFIDPDYSNHATVPVEQQAISGCPLYKRASLIRCNFRCFHRSDGYLLTMCANGGIDYIDRLLDERIDKPGDSAFQDEDGSMIGLLFELFSQSGSSSWHTKSADWLLVYILTEVTAKPTNFRQGCNAPSLMKAYQSVVQSLKMKRYAEFKRNESVLLVREYLACIDELTTVVTISTRHRTMLEHLRGQVLEMESQHERDENESVNFPGGESAMDRVNWAAKITLDNETAAAELLSDLQKSLTALFQLRSIEQNELAIVADHQNKAILLFTGVTIVFLPLSFFTSYFGMNLKGVANTNKTEDYFWKLCGSIGFAIMLAVTLWVARHRVAAQMRRMTVAPA